MPHTVPNPPLSEYTARLQAREQAAATLATQHRRLSYVRLGLAAAILVAAILAYDHGARTLSIAVGIPIALFLVAVVAQARVEDRQTRATRAIAHYRHGLARIEDRWPGLHPRDHRTAPPHHLYASDLNLFGHGSVFELLCTARTRMGEEALSAWLLAPATLPEIAARHAALFELRDRLDLHEAMAVLGPTYLQTTTIAVQPASLLEWSEAPNPLPPTRLRWLAAALAILALTAAVYWAETHLLAPLLAVIAVEYVLAFVLRARMQKVFDGADRTLEGLQLLAALLARIESEPLQSPRLVELQATLRRSSLPASQAISALARLVPYIDALHNPFVRLIDVPLGYSIQLAYAVQRWRNVHGRAVRDWLTAFGEIEALLSLATYSYEHPNDPLPIFLTDSIRPDPALPASFEAEALGHPLIPTAQCVTNDVRLAEPTRALIVSGSNMSGKSTLMRAVGLNAVLAMAGAPVRALSLRLTPLAVGASILINDSLEEGSSRFYAEITRIQQICALAKQTSQQEERSVLFLLDELLQGTNSHDRLTGATGVVRALLNNGAIGILSTHDLALTALAEGDPRLRNAHLQDGIEDGRMVFDHTLRDGIVTRSNGIELMRLVGLDV